MTQGIYTKHIIEVVQFMVSEGASNREIAMAIGTTENRLASRMCQLKIRRGLVGKTLNVRVPVLVAARFEPAAARRGLNVQTLIRLLLDRIAKDDICSAIIDDGK